MKKFFGHALVLGTMIGLGLIHPVTARAETVITNLDATVLANALTNGGLITISNVSGTFVLTRPLEITNTTTIDAGTNTVVISGSGAMRVFSIHTNSAGTNIFVTLRNLQIKSGRSTNGGGLYNGFGCNLTLVSNLFSGNSVTNTSGRNGSVGHSGGDNGENGGSGGSAFGGAIYSIGTMVISNCYFTLNTANAGNAGNGGNGQSDFIFGGNGGNGGTGGTAGGSAIYSIGSSSIYNCNFSQNDAISGNGGTAGAAGSGPFPGNPGNPGGGGTATGAIYVAGPIGITNSVFWDNQITGGNSGGTSAAGGNALGAGVYVSSAPAAEASFENCTFYTNICSGGIGGLGGGGALATARISSLRNCTIAANNVFSGTNSTVGSGNGGNIYCISGTCTILNTILAKSTNSPNCVGAITDGGYNISSDATPKFTVTTSRNNLNPLLDSTLKTNGGYTMTLALLLGSPAIDRIPTNFTYLYPTNDQRGTIRPQGTNADIGAFEFVPLFQINGKVRSGNAGVSSVTITITTPTNYVLLVTNVTASTTNVVTNTITLNTNGVVTSDSNGNFSFTNLPANTYLISPFITNGTSFSPSNQLVTVGGSQGITNIYFELTSLARSAAYIDLHDFPTNSSPRGPLIMDANGNIYGTTYSGGSNNFGTIFEYAANGAYSDIHLFNGTNGANPFGGVILGSDGNLYGTTYAGGASNLGTIFRRRVVGNDIYTNFVSFLGSNGAQPYAGLVQSSIDHNFYGTTSVGGTANQGTVFKMNLDGVMSNLYSFTGGNDGGRPLSALTLGTNGSLYGTTFSGGAANLGTIFNITSNGVFNVLYSFSGSDGAFPAAPLTLGRNGYFYGTTSAGGPINAGTIFKIAPDGTFTSLHYITNPNALLTNAAIIQGLDGDFYLNAYSGGTNNLGFSLRFSETNILGEFNFTGTNGPNFGSHPYAGLIQSSNGILYGVTSDGGTATGGALFRVGLPPVVITPPVNITLSPTNLIRSSAVFSVTVQGSTPLSYHWLKNYTNLVASAHLRGVTNSSLTITNVVAADIGTYSVVVTNAFGLVESAGAELIIGYPPKITVQPVSLLRQPVGADVNYKVTVTGAPALAYQWYKWTTNSTNMLIDGGNISGSTTTNLTVGSITTGDIGSYSIHISNGFGATNSAGAVLTTIVDVTKPTILIASPTLNVRTDFPFLIGTASDNVRVSSVSYWITNIHNGTNIISGLATLDSGVKIRSWIIVTNLNPGTNILAVQATDFSGQTSAIVSRAFFYKVPSPLNLPKAGTGNGSFTGTASIVGDPTPTDGAMLNIGERYTVTAVPDTNSFFTNWTGAFGTTTNPTISFTMEAGTNFTANFVTNLFIKMAGTYNGLFYQPTASNDLSAATFETSGLISTFKTSNKGAYSGRLLMGTAAYTLAGNFNKGGIASNSIPRAPALGGRMIVWLTNAWNDTPRQILGTVTGTNLGGWTSSVALVTAATNAQSSLEYTMLMPPDTNTPGASPAGTSYALITNKAGTLILTVKLADAAAVFSQTIPLSEAKFAPLYQSLYNNTGCLMGWLDFDGSTLGDNIPVGTLAWIKKSSKVSLLYTNGFTNLVSLQGSIWLNPGRTNVLPATNILEISGGDLTVSLTNHVLLGTNNVLTKSSGPTNSLAGTIDPKTGLLTVTFGNGNAKATTVATGAVLQSAGTAAGSFLGKTNSGSISLHP